MSFFSGVASKMGVAAEGAANVVGMIVRSQCRGQFVVLFIDVVDQRVDVPRRVNQDDLAGTAAADQVGVILHRPNLDLLNN